MASGGLCRSLRMPILSVMMSRAPHMLGRIEEAVGLDAVIFLKSGMSAFSNRELETYLARERIGSLVMAGWVRHLCVMATASDALSKGFEVMMTDQALFGITDIRDDIARAMALRYFRKHADLSDTLGELIWKISLNSY
jgi:nicotinamidase-related amidase